MSRPRVNFRIDGGDLARIDSIVDKQDEYKNRSELFRAAVKYFLKRKRR